MRVIIVGLGDIGRELAHSLVEHEKNELVLIDADKEVADSISEEMDALVIHGDATDPEILKKAQIAEADALVATTGEDPINTVVAMLARQLDVKRIVVKLNGLGLRPARQTIGVSRVVAPKIAAVANIESALYGTDQIDFSMVARGGLRLTELSAGHMKYDKISDLGIPDGAHIVAVQRDEDVLLPRKDMSLEEEDSVYFLIESEGVRQKMKSAFGMTDNEKGDGLEENQEEVAEDENKKQE